VLCADPECGVAGPDDPIGGGWPRSPWPGIETTLRSPKGRCSAPQHLVLCSTYTPLSQEYAVFVAWLADAA
jgi:hypothetical protein